MAEDSIFSKIISGEVKGWKIYEDELACAFLDAFPVTEGHVIVAYKGKEKDIFELTDKNFIHLAKISRDVAKAMKKKLNANFVNILTAQSMIKHAFIHVVPRFDYDLMGVVPDMENKRQIEKGTMNELQKKLEGEIDVSKKV
ncbi:MAG: HIT family protein [Candidatus Altiarchaeota archaeon]|nr:HIT family protein [Candidatus Altiarchaeota archaeon]